MMHIYKVTHSSHLYKQSGSIRSFNLSQQSHGFWHKRKWLTPHPGSCWDVVFALFKATSSYSSLPRWFQTQRRRTAYYFQQIAADTENAASSTLRCAHVRDDVLWWVAAGMLCQLMSPVQRGAREAQRQGQKNPIIINIRGFIRCSEMNQTLMFLCVSSFSLSEKLRLRSCLQSLLNRKYFRCIQSETYFQKDSTN